MAAHLLGALAHWNALERATDRWASLVALAFAVIAGYVALHWF